MNANTLRSQFEKPVALTTLAVLGTTGVAACSFDGASAQSNQKAIVCEGEQNVAVLPGETMSELVDQRVHTQGISPADLPRLVDGIVVQSADIGNTFVVKGSYEHQDPQVVAGTSVTLPTHCEVK